jgi:hypothetical protein
MVHHLRTQGRGAKSDMKRIIGAAVAGVLAFSGIYALAASLTVSSNTLGAGTSVVSSCTADTLTVGYGTLTYSASVPGYTLTTVTITDNTAAPNWAKCEGLAYKVTLEGATNNQMVETTGTVPAALGTTKGSFFTTPVFAAQNASLVTGVAVVIGG